MKKLNRKGFTLVELLAVIIILAVVVGITIPAVLTTTQKAKAKSFQSAADTAADWFDRQYQVYMTGLNDTGIATLDANFTSACTTGSNNCIDQEAVITSEAVINAAGLKASNIASMTVKIDSATGRSCVTLVAKAGGDYEGAGNGTKQQQKVDESGNEVVDGDGNPVMETVEDKNKIQSSGC